MRIPSIILSGTYFQLHWKWMFIGVIGKDKGGLAKSCQNKWAIPALMSPLLSCDYWDIINILRNTSILKVMWRYNFNFITSLANFQFPFHWNLRVCTMKNTNFSTQHQQQKKNKEKLWKWQKLLPSLSYNVCQCTNIKSSKIAGKIMEIYPF